MAGTKPGHDEKYQVLKNGLIPGALHAQQNRDERNQQADSGKQRD
jgi:hypothetical protein